MGTDGKFFLHVVFQKPRTLWQEKIESHEIRTALRRGFEESEHLQNSHFAIALECAICHAGF